MMNFVVMKLLKILNQLFLIKLSGNRLRFRLFLVFLRQLLMDNRGRMIAKVRVAVEGHVENWGHREVGV